MHFRATGLDLPATESRTYGLPREYAVALVLTGVERAPPKVEAGGSNPPGAARFDARKARSPRLIARRLETASSAAKAHRVTLDDEPDKRAGAVLKTDRRREARGEQDLRHPPFLDSEPVGRPASVGSGLGAERAADRVRRCPPPWRVNRTGAPARLRTPMAPKGVRLMSSALRHKRSRPAGCTPAPLRSLQPRHHFAG
jgi:hypothetical protein